MVIEETSRRMGHDRSRMRFAVASRPIFRLDRDEYRLNICAPIGSSLCSRSCQMVSLIVRYRDEQRSAMIDECFRSRTRQHCHVFSIMLRGKDDEAD